jgi:hypothetical protein
VNEELRGAATDIFADNEFKRPGIEDSIKVSISISAMALEIEDGTYS